MDAKIRLYVDHPLGAGQSVPLDRGQSHYLFGVMRQAVGGAVLLFNGRDGEWTARITEAGKRGGTLVCETQRDVQRDPRDLWLLFAPVKKARTDFIVEKATEMGVGRIVPVMTEYTNTNRVQTDRLQAHALEAAEQCGAMYVPQVADAVKLSRLLDGWDAGRMILFCDEALAGHGPGPGLEQFDPVSVGPWAILIGPEGGFSDAERTRLDRLEGSVLNISLGPRILRADTAAVAALTLWQQTLGDWNDT